MEASECLAPADGGAADRTRAHPRPAAARAPLLPVSGKEMDSSRCAGQA